MARADPQDAERSKALHEHFMLDVRRAAMRLAQAPTIGRSDLDRAVDSIDATPVSLALLELVMSTSGIGWMEVLLGSLALRHSVKGTPYEEPWLGIFGRNATTAILKLRLFGLFELRLELLDELIARPQEMSLAELHLERANTRRVLAGRDRDAMCKVWDDLRVAIAQARREGNIDAYVNVLSFQAKLAAGSAGAGGDRAATGAELDEQIRTLLTSPPVLEPRHRMQLLQARATLARTTRPSEAIEALEAALAISATGDALRVELAAELVSVLDATERRAEAIMRGLGYLAEPTRRGPDQDVPLAMLHLGVGSALTSSGRFREGREHLLAGLEGVRGRDRLEDRRKLDALQHLAFIAWVG